MKKFLLGLMLVLVVVMPTSLVFAQDAGTAKQLASKSDDCGWDFVYCGMSKFFNWASLSVGYLIAAVAGYFITLAAALIGVLINLGSQVLSSPLVREGFKLTLSITNLGFVIAIIIIAFGTMLRLQGYGMKQMIWKLVVAALLVNFSFTFAGVIIDASNVFGNYFLQAAAPEGEISQFATNIAASLNVSGLSGIKPSATTANIGGDILKFVASYVGSFVSVSAIAIFMTILVITFFAIAFMLLVRYVYLIFLLIVMPLAWLAWIFPNLSSHTSEWWRTFWKWNFFFPAVSFFLYLSILTSDKLGAVINGNSIGSEALKGAATASGLAESALTGFLQIIVQVGMVIGGLIVAQKLGIDGSSAAMKMADQAKGWVIGATGKTIRGATGITAAQAGVVRPAQAGAANALANLLNKPALRWIPGAKTAVSNLNIAASRSKEVEDYQKQYLSNLTEEQFAKVQGTTPIGPVAQAALLAESVKRKKIAGLTATAKTPEEKTARLKGFVEAAKKVNPGIASVESIPIVKEAFDADPKLASQLTGKSLREIAAKLRADKAADVAAHMFNEKEFILGLSQSAISDIYRRGTSLQRAGIKKTLQDIVSVDPHLNDLFVEISNLEKSIAEAKRIGDEKTLSKLREDLAILVPSEKSILEELRKKGEVNALAAYKKLKFAQQNIGDDE